MTPTTRRRRTARGLAWGLVAGLCFLHGAAVWVGLGGWDGLTGPWPPARHDHPLYFHSALVTRAFLHASGTTAGYDPSFMAGYAKSVIFPASSTLPELVVLLAGGSRPEVAYKAYVLVGTALVPWLVAWAVVLWRGGAGAAATTVGLALLYVWTDYPINYAEFGMVPYLMGMPLGLVATGAVARSLRRGGAWRWLGAATACALAVLVHLTAAMVVVPAAAAAYVVAARRGLSWRGHLATWAIPAFVLGANAFWWWPGPWLASTKGPSDFAFAHPEPVARRLWEIVGREGPIQAVLWGLGLLGLAALRRKGRVGWAALGGFAAAGFFWGYLAGFFRALDFLQPGRHTYALYLGLAVAGGLGLAEALRRLREGGRGRLDVWAALALGLVGFRLFAPAVEATARARVLGPEPFLTSRPGPHLEWIVARVREHLKPGERLLYEEGGFGLPGVPDPFAGGRYSGLLPHLTGVEVLGGPYLHAALTTNFTQFGEGKLFGRSDWDRAWFEQQARLYRPAAIVCWSPRARAFCEANADLIDLLGRDGPVLFGRVRGFGGATIRGTATVRAEPGRLRVEGAAADLDGWVVLRYHSVPYLRCDPPAHWGPVLQEGDPVPFIGLRPPAGPVTLELDLPP